MRGPEPVNIIIAQAKLYLEQKAFTAILVEDSQWLVWESSITALSENPLLLRNTLQLVALVSQTMMALHINVTSSARSNQ